MADMTMSCAVEDTTMRAEMPARMTSETAACAREDTEAYARAELPSERTDRTSKRVNDHDAVDGSRTRNADPIGVRRQFEKRPRNEISLEMNEKRGRGPS